MTHHGEGDYMLEARELTLDIGNRRVLEDVNLGVQEGEAYCILGGSGAGKSMLLRTIVRLHDATSGQVLLGGVPVTDMPVGTLRRRVGLVQQNPAMLEGSVEDNIRYGLEQAELPEEEVELRTREALGHACLADDCHDRRADRLSGGERQRVAIARAHALRPEILLLDEPTAALDPRTTREVEEAILRLKGERGSTMIVVTHDLAQARRLGDRTALMRRGCIVAEGETATFLEGLDPEERSLFLGELELDLRTSEGGGEDG